MNSTLLSKKVTTFYPQKYLSADNAGQFAQELQSVIETSKDRPLLVNMEKVEFIDSAGLMVLIDAYRFAKDLDCRMNFCSVAAPVKMVLELTQLDNVFNIFDNHDSFTESQAA